MAISKEQLDPLYRQYFKRNATDEDVTGWQSYTGNDLAGKFKEAAGMEVAKDPFNQPYSEVNQQGYTGGKPIDWESYIRQAYEAKQPEIESQIKGAAAGGGLDTGGYMTSLAKAKTASWSDMLGQIMGAKQAQQSFDWQKQLPFIQRNWEGQDWQKNKDLALEIADLSKPSDWEKFLGLVNAGANVVDAYTPG